MAETQGMEEQFERERPRLRGLAYRILGSIWDADDAVQEAWLRLSQRQDTAPINNLPGWLTTATARIGLDMLRARQARRESPTEDTTGRTLPLPDGTVRGPDQETELAEAVGQALLVVLERLPPAERVAFVMHDMFALSFEEIAVILDRSVPASRQLASRARRRVRSPAAHPMALAKQQSLAERFLAALRARDVEGLIAILDPDAVFQAPGAGVGSGVVRGASAWAHGAVHYAAYARFMEPALVDGSVALVVAPGGRLQRVLMLQFESGRISGGAVVDDPARLQNLTIRLLAS